MKEYQGVSYNDGRLTEPEFFRAYPDTQTFSSWGGRFVGSALTLREYICFNHTTGEYDSERR